MDQALKEGGHDGTDITVPVSVVIPCYRCHRSIGAAVESVVNQTARPVELILVEDCSEDGGQTLAALEALKREYQKRLRVVVVPLPDNRGAGEARNAGWAIASQRLLAFLDADDTWHPRKLEIQSAWMLSHPDYALTCHGSILCSRGEPVLLAAGGPPEREMAWRKLLFRNDVATRTVMLRRVISHRFPGGVRYAEDYQLWLRILLGGGAAMRLCLPLACSYKDGFGAGGLSGDLAAMHGGVVRCLDALREDRLISLGMYFLAAAFEWLKYGRRAMMVATGRGKRGGR